MLCWLSRQSSSCSGCWGRYLESISAEAQVHRARSGIRSIGWENPKRKSTRTGKRSESCAPLKTGSVSQKKTSIETEGRLGRCGLQQTFWAIPAKRLSKTVRRLENYGRPPISWGTRKKKFTRMARKWVSRCPEQIYLATRQRISTEAGIQVPRKSRKKVINVE